jgi:hypothetical protein
VFDNSLKALQEIPFPAGFFPFPPSVHISFIDSDFPLWDNPSVLI